MKYLKSGFTAPTVKNLNLHLTLSGKKSNKGIDVKWIR
ncbi:hypothetical protein DET54_12130 [Paenibacillus pabuli]|uniref:Uncharacterized protein n=1 Tax=Paenibacillus pabuli TaxID=1472 RepID=A0A855Y0U1_9BACL|nr:hypothetical protein DET56_10261 [Paenibacillus pabuli]PXW09864.1 hypothetical protein DEU73_10261 [Paenibacillus taichungensis]RAI85673.1 hypothetical protein DET54_12130 [Paenibacillus pabuli]